MVSPAPKTRVSVLVSHPSLVEIIFELANESRLSSIFLLSNLVGNFSRDIAEEIRKEIDGSYNAAGE